MARSSTMIGIFLAMAACIANVQARYSVAMPYAKVTVEKKDGLAVFNGAGLFVEPGQPQLPQYTVTFLVPPEVNCKEVKVALNDLVETDVEGTFDVEPGLPMSARGEIIWPKDRKIVKGRDVAIYNRDSYFPASTTGKVSFGKMRQYQLAEVQIFPYKYNPVTRKLRVVTGGTLTITLPKSTAPSSTRRSEKKAVHPSDEKYLRSRAANFSAISSYNETVQPMAQGAAAPLAETPETFVIMKPSALQTNHDYLQAWILEKWATYNLVILTENELFTPGMTADQRADAMRAWLQANYLTMNIRNVCIIGNPDPVQGDFPMKMCYPRLSEQDREAPTDYYYADVSGDWDINRNSIAGEYDDFAMPGGPDKYPEIAVGRFPYYGILADLEIMAKNNSNTQTYCEWKKTAILPMKPLDEVTPMYQLGEQIRNNILIPNQISSCRLYDDFNTYKPLGNEVVREVANLNPLPEKLGCTLPNVVDAWKKGFGINHSVGLVVWSSHGYPQGAADVMNSESSAGLNSYPAIVFQASCGNAQPEYNEYLHEQNIGIFVVRRPLCHVFRHRMVPEALYI